MFYFSDFSSNNLFDLSWNKARHKKVVAIDIHMNLVVLNLILHKFRYLVQMADAVAVLTETHEYHSITNDGFSCKCKACTAL